MLNEEWADQWAQAVAKAWVDPKYHDHLVRDPREALRAVGLNVPEHVAVSVDRGASEHKLTLALPAPPADVNEQNVREHVQKLGPQKCGC
jgi:hypothetical protein